MARSQSDGSGSRINSILDSMSRTLDSLEKFEWAQHEKNLPKSQYYIWKDKTEEGKEGDGEGEDSSESGQGKGRRPVTPPVPPVPSRPASLPGIAGGTPGGDLLTSGLEMGHAIGGPLGWIAETIEKSLAVIQTAEKLMALFDKIGNFMKNAPEIGTKVADAMPDVFQVKGEAKDKNESSPLPLADTLDQHKEGYKLSPDVPPPVEPERYNLALDKPFGLKTEKLPGEVPAVAAKTPEVPRRTYGLAPKVEPVVPTPEVTPQISDVPSPETFQLDSPVLPSKIKRERLVQPEIPAAQPPKKTSRYEFAARKRQLKSPDSNVGRWRTGKPRWDFDDSYGSGPRKPGVREYGEPVPTVPRVHPKPPKLQARNASELYGEPSGGLSDALVRRKTSRAIEASVPDIPLDNDAATMTRKLEVDRTNKMSDLAAWGSKRSSGWPSRDVWGRQKMPQVPETISSSSGFAGLPPPGGAGGPNTLSGDLIVQLTEGVEKFTESADKIAGVLKDLTGIGSQAGSVRQSSTSTQQSMPWTQAMGGRSPTTPPDSLASGNELGHVLGQVTQVAQSAEMIAAL